MLNNIKTPCIQCPFKKTSMRGWLGGFSVMETYNTVLHEGDFACHLTRGNEDDADEDGEDIQVGEMSRCRGSLLFLKKACKIPKYNTQLAAVLKSIRTHETDNILSQTEFIAHHTI